MQVTVLRIGVAAGRGLATGRAGGGGAAGRVVDRRCCRARRGIGERTGNAARASLAVRAGEVHLVAAHRGGAVALVGTVVFVGFLAAAEIDLRGDLRVHVAAAE